MRVFSWRVVSRDCVGLFLDCSGATREQDEMFGSVGRQPASGHYTWYVNDLVKEPMFAEGVNEAAADMIRMVRRMKRIRDDDFIPSVPELCIAPAPKPQAPIYEWCQTDAPENLSQTPFLIVTMTARVVLNKAGWTPSPPDDPRGGINRATVGYIDVLGFPYTYSVRKQKVVMKPSEHVFVGYALPLEEGAERVPISASHNVAQVREDLETALRERSIVPAGAIIQGSKALLPIWFWSAAKRSS